MRNKTICLLLVILSVTVFSTSAISAVYVYVGPDGSTLITDKRIKKTGFKLKRSYKTKPYRSGGSKRPYFHKPIKSQYDALIVNTALKYNLEPSFIKAVIHVESAFDHLAVSKAGAMGLMQLMPATAASYQLTTNTFRPERNIEAGVRHMRDLMDRYSSNKRLSLAAYNAGAGAVSKYKGIPPFKETQEYVVKVMKLYNLYKKEI
ncbi:MAG: lytic transglycosylase domain-containing protein [Acidiferrobacterales bacterium]|nr:lytic transglycosylase domain-containing protein [Acidiferrobacterales bacterium]